ncbi:MAG: vitamin K epoxide reductase family protein [Candidatus Caldarchaeales archaeon]
MNKKIWNFSLIVISLAGIGLSLTLEYISNNPVCPIGFEGCDQVLLSPYSKIFGISWAILGASWFTVLFILTIFTFHNIRRSLSLILLGWSLISIPSVIILVLIEIFLVGAICIYCTISHIIGLSSILPAYKISKQS